MSVGLVVAIILGAAVLGMFALAFGSGGGAPPLDYRWKGADSKGLVGGLLGSVV